MYSVIKGGFIQIQDAFICVVSLRELVLVQCVPQEACVILFASQNLASTVQP